MTDTFVTQCPHCQTSFRLQHSQLIAARGSVRCGACLQVFNAASQISQESIATTQQVAVQPTPPPTIAVVSTANEVENNTAEPASTAKKPLMIHDDMDLGDLDDLDLDEELARLEQEEQQRSKELSGEFAALQASAKPSPAPVEDTLEDVPAAAFNDFSDELLAQEPVAQLSSVEPEITEPATLPLVGTENKNTTTQFQRPLEPVRMEPMSGQLPNFSDGPLRLDWQPKKSPWRRWLAWGVLNICAVLLLVGQYTYNNFAQLARQDSTRPWLEIVCPLIDCQLPSKVDVEKIKSSNLLVRSHPEFSGALLVDAIIYNRASFAQPFPLLKLTFADQQGQVLASRLFKPIEYLGGELAGQNQMPQQTPIHIALEILEPRGGAVNYTLDFVSPD